MPVSRPSQSQDGVLPRPRPVQRGRGRGQVPGRDGGQRRLRTHEQTPLDVGARRPTRADQRLGDGQLRRDMEGTSAVLRTRGEW